MLMFCFFSRVIAGDNMEKRQINSKVSIKRAELKDEPQSKQQSDTMRSPLLNAAKATRSKRNINSSVSIKKESYSDRIIPPKKFKISEDDYLLIRRDVIPKNLISVLKVKEALYRGEAINMEEACEEYEISSKYYRKYKNAIIPFYEATNGKIFTLLFEAEYQEKVLSDIVSTISKHSGSIITVNQGFPFNGIININISFDTTSLKINLYELLSKLKSIVGVRNMEIIGRTNNNISGSKK